MNFTKEEKDLLIKEIKESLKEKVTVYVETTDDDVTLPTYSNIGDAGMDIRANKSITLHPGETKVIPTGLKMVIPEGYELQVRPRSGLSLKTPLRVSNTPGTIDSGYRDEIGIIISNTSLNNDDVICDIDEKNNKSATYVIKKNDRVAQIVLNKYEKVNFEQVECGKIEKIGTNRNGGFGHTGTK